MKRKILLKFGAPILALSLVAACGTGDDMDPTDEDAPLDQEENGNLPDDGGMDDEGEDLEEPDDNLYDDEDAPGGQGNQ